MLNLLSNAIKYSEEGQSIHVQCRVNPFAVEISVKDNGIGIPEEEQKNLFGKFYRARNAVNHQGTGLGLNIVKRYIDLLDGDIRFTSHPNEGTEFTISYPHKIKL